MPLTTDTKSVLIRNVDEATAKRMRVLAAELGCTRAELLRALLADEDLVDRLVERNKR